jgi:hypothetical protein
MFGLGTNEILVLLLLGGLLVCVVLILLFLVRRASGISALEKEVRLLREELDRQRGRT